MSINWGCNVCNHCNQFETHSLGLGFSHSNYLTACGYVLITSSCRQTIIRCTSSQDHFNHFLQTLHRVEWISNTLNNQATLMIFQYKLYINTTNLLFNSLLVIPISTYIIFLIYTTSLTLAAQPLPNFSYSWSQRCYSHRHLAAIVFLFL